MNDPREEWPLYDRRTWKDTAKAIVAAVISCATTVIVLYGWLGVPRLL